MGRLERLIATRDRIAGALADEPSPRDLPALSREYRMVLAEIDALDVREESDVVDQLAARRNTKTARRTKESG